MDNLLNEIKQQLLILKQQDPLKQYTDTEVFELVCTALAELRKRNVPVLLLHLNSQDTATPSQSTQQSIYSKPITEVGVYTVEDIQKILGIGKNQAYALANSGVFPVIKLGRKIIVSKQRFWEWVNSNQSQCI